MGTSTALRDLPARLEGAGRRFERWRRTRRVGSRIPEPLWDAAVKLAGRYGIHRTAKALRLDYYSLKRRVEWEAAAKKQAEGKTAGKKRVEKKTAARRRFEKKSAIGASSGPEAAPAATFLELPTPAWSGCGECTLELEDAGGARMRIHLKGLPAPDLAALGRSFWQVEP